MPSNFNKLLFSCLVLLSSCGWGSKSKRPPSAQDEIQKKQSQEGSQAQSQAQDDNQEKSVQAQSKQMPEELPPVLSAAMDKYCQKIEGSFKKYNWSTSNCDHYHWIHVRNSIQGDPLSWVVFGDEKVAQDQDHDTTLIMCAVHGDEITPVKFCFDIMDEIKQNGHLYKEQKKLVVVVPIVNPDSFFNSKPSRVNARGVDINRNFPTGDWYAKALKNWKGKNAKDARRFPGHKPLSEPETLFQVNLIKRYGPDKIISVHAPLTLLDYDGPSITQRSKKSHDHNKEALGLLAQMGQLAGDYRVKNFPFYPGSLGNWAGNERGIPTYTLELPSSDPRKSKVYWEQFKEAIQVAITSDLRNDAKSAKVEAGRNQSSNTP